MKLRLSPVLLCAFLMLESSLTGCSAIMSGQTQTLTFETQPPGADVIIDGKVMGRTPISAVVDRDARSVTFRKQGFGSETQPLVAVLNPWFWANIPFGGVVLGMTVDLVSGASNQFQPAAFYSTLYPEISLSGKLVKEEQAQQARDFIVSYYKDLRSDLAHGGGRNFATLMEILEIPSQNKTDALDRLRSLSEFYTDVSAFARAAVEDLTTRGYSFGKEQLDARNRAYRRPSHDDE